MELYMLEIFLRHAQHIATVGKENITSVLVLRHILILALLEILQFRLVVALYPASLVEMHWFPAALGIVLILKTILYYLKLQLSHCANYLSAVKLVYKQLRHAFVHQLVDALLQLLCLKLQFSLFQDLFLLSLHQQNYIIHHQNHLSYLMKN